MTGPTPRRLWQYVTRQLGLQRYFRSPGDGRPQPQVPAQALLWTMLVGQLLREWSYNGLEALVRSRARRALGVSTDFGDDTLGYFTERLDPAPTRAAIVQVVRRAKRNKAFDNSRFIGLARGGAFLVPLGQESVGNRESRVQRRQEPTRPGTSLPS